MTDAERQTIARDVLRERLEEMSHAQVTGFSSYLYDYARYYFGSWRCRRRDLSEIFIGVARGYQERQFAILFPDAARGE